MPPITLTTDFGLDDGYVGAMKGVILSLLPTAQIVDITHAIAPQNIPQAAYILSTATPYFPPHTVHVVVVDPGVGSERRPLAVFTDRAVYVGPDNGVFSQVYEREPVREIRQLTNPAYHLPAISHTFHGRDIFSPVAAHIALGAPASNLGPEISDPVRLQLFDFAQNKLPAPARGADGSLHGQVIYADRFGNLITDIPVTWLEGRTDWYFEMAGITIVGFHSTYSRVEPGAWVALGSSAGLIEIAIRNGNAAAQLEARGYGVGVGFSVYRLLGNSKAEVSLPGTKTT